MRSIDEEELWLMASIDEFIARETWLLKTHSGGGESCASAHAMFVAVKQSLERIAALSRGMPLFLLARAFLRLLRRYAAELRALVSSDAVRNHALRVTAAYCHDRTINLGDVLCRLLEYPFNERVDTSEAEDAFRAV